MNVLWGMDGNAWKDILCIIVSVTGEHPGPQELRQTCRYYASSSNNQTVYPSTGLKSRPSNKS